MHGSLHSRTAPQRVRVWDLPTRVFHWLLVACVAVALATGFLAPEWWMGVHIVAGYGLVLLLVFRLIWGVFGSEYARMLSMARSMRHFGDYLRGLALLRPPHYVGHNPVGAAMIHALLAVFTALVVTGLIVQAGEEKQGPLAGIASFATGIAAKELHEWLAFAAIAMIIVHIAGVLVESRLQKTNLVRGMIDGWMRLPEGFHLPPQRPARPLAAAFTLAAIAAAAAAVLGLLSRLPPHGVPDMPVSATYRAECGDCHWAYHPSLLPRASWAGIMNSLGDHFGEDATLGANEAAEIAAYLEHFAAEAWDTEAANRLATTSSDAPLRITLSPYFVRKHREIQPAVFERTGIRSRGNCIACHRDADSGRFDDQAIDIPKGVEP
jgi:cytochrome b